MLIIMLMFPYSMLKINSDQRPSCEQLLKNQIFIVNYILDKHNCVVNKIQKKCKSFNYYLLTDLGSNEKWVIKVIENK